MVSYQGLSFDFGCCQIGQLNGVHRQTGLREWKPKLLSPLVTNFIPVTMAPLFMSPLDRDRDGWGKKLTDIQVTLSYPLDY